MFEPTDRERGLQVLVELALAEDLGPGDVTGEATVPESASARAKIAQKAPGVIFGLDVVETVFGQLDPAVEVQREAEEGIWREPGRSLTVATVTGPARSILAGERTALNFFGQLSGVATMTALFVEAVRGTRARILDTRKTTPGMRHLEKAAVLAGGGGNHRVGLYDAYLVKENHLALAGGVAPAIVATREHAARAEASGELDAPLLEVECESLDQLREAIAAGADRALLDNMDLATMRRAVELRDAEAGRPDGSRGDFLLEASGGISLENAREVAETGVDLISVGSLTHSAPALDLSMIVEIA